METRSTERKVRWTYAEYARLPEAGSTRYEVIADELVMTPAPSLHHQRIATRLSSLLHSYVDEHGLGEVFSGPVDVLFRAGDYLQPDILFVGVAKLHIRSPRGLEGAPDLVVEIMSPSTAHRDRGIKHERYRMYGVPEYWIVDPDEGRMEVWHLGAGAEAPDIFDGIRRFAWQPSADAPPLEIDLTDLFRA